MVLTDLETEVIQANDMCAQFCRFLSSLYLYELTSEEVERFARMGFTDDGSTMAKGYKTIHEYLRHRNTATRQELAVDYSHTFLGAGVYDEIMAPPYESVFTSKQRLLMQVARDGALMYYRSENLTLGDENNTPEDHLGFELQFMAEIIDRSSQALRSGDTDRFRELVNKERSFLKFHQENWLPDFCDAIDTYALTDFYKGVADLTRGYLEITRSVLDDIAQEYEFEPEEVELRPAWADADEELDRKMAFGGAFTGSSFNAVKAEAKKLGATMPRNE